MSLIHIPTTSRIRRPAPPWLAVKALFDRLVDLPPPARRTALAAAADGLTADVLAEVQALLEHHHAEEHSGNGFLAAPALLPQAVPLDRRGQRVGAWVLTERLGSGGMGEVWAAQRADGAYDAQVAVKLLRAELASSALVQRFAQERRTLARVDHPHIARLLDAGATPDGAPYFVMEAVQGQRIDAACRGLPLAARLRLFLQLTDAVAHAHRHLLVHRDLKPANVLVTGAPALGQGVVKLLDFGIAGAPEELGAGDGAGALEPVDAAGRPAAPAALVPMTPGCASPEQVRGEPLGTASDVYALGVLLHVVLTGSRPYGRAGDTPEAAMHAVLHQAPQPPSEAAARAPAGAGAEAGARVETSDAVPAAALRGDIDAIVARALDKRIDGRYPSVDALAADLRAHLQGRPVSARPGSWRYRAALFVRRHRIGVAIAGTGMACLLAALGGLAWQVGKTDAARRDAEAQVAEVRQLANRLVFSYHDRIVNLAGALPARQALLSDALTYLDGLSRRAPRDPVLARELAQTYHRVAVLYGETFSANLGQFAAAEASLDKALALLPLYIDEASDATGNAPGAASNRAPAGTRSTPAAALNEAADMWQMRAQLHAREGRLQASVQALDQAQRLVERALLLAPQDMQVLSRQATLAGRRAQALGSTPSLANLGRVAEAGQQWQLALRVFDSLVAREPQVAEWQHQLGWALSGQTGWAILDGRADDALRSSERLVQTRQAAAALRPDDGHLRYQSAAMAAANRASALSAAGRHDEAAAWLAQAHGAILATARAEPDNRSAARDLVLVELTRGRQLVTAGRPAAALPVLQQVLAQLPPAQAPGSDFFMARWRAEALVWLARARLASTDADARAYAYADRDRDRDRNPDPDPDRDANAASALRDAQQAAALMQPRTGDAQADDNAARRWMLAQALGEQAQALSRLQQPAAAAAAASQAAAAWGTAVPGSLLAHADSARQRAGLPPLQRR